MASIRHAPRVGLLPLHGWMIIWCCCGAGCGSGPPSEPDTKVRLTKLVRLYQLYVDRNRKGPPSEQVLREFGQKLTPQERTDYLLGDDLDNIYTSPRDKQNFVIQYNLTLQPGGATRAVAWEATSQNGRRFVALSRGDVDEYDEQSFQEYKK